MLKKLCALFLIGCFICTDLYAGKNVKGSFELSQVTPNKGYVEGTLQNLDFSNEDSDLNCLVFANSSDALYSFAKNDLGLKNNIHLTTIICCSPAYEIPISFTYLPYVELYKVNGGYTGLSYLASAFPSLKKLEIAAPLGRNNYGKLFENLGHLENLEEVCFENWQGDLTLTAQEIYNLTQIPSMKTIVIRWGLCSQKPIFDKQALDTLNTVRPDIKVQVNYTIMWD